MIDVHQALAQLGKKRLVLAIHDASFPGDPDQDLGRGSPYEPSAQAFFEEVRRLGFNAIQLGPQGQTTYDNPSPYDATAFSRSWLSIALLPLVEEGWLDAELFARLRDERPDARGRAAYRYAYRAKRAALERIAIGAFRREVAEYRARHRDWIEPDGAYDAFESKYEERHWREWPSHAQRFAATAENEAAIERWASWQWIAERQHRSLRARCAELGIALYGDLQVGLSPRDVWRWRELFLSGWTMGAPPSRTNPEGQPWGYPVLDPERLGDGARQFLLARIERVTSAYDGLRIDHPHGLVCPWVYRDEVKEGARLFCSPDHPELARYAIPRLDQIDRTKQRWADERVQRLDPEQVERYSALFDIVVSRAGTPICEVLSTQPYPLEQVIARHGLGRFRVTQKANLDDPTDVYRSENARPEDWIMVGTHDTKPIWLLAKEWQESGAATQQARYLAGRLLPRANTEEVERFARELAEDRSALVHAKFADVFASEAENVMIFFADLYGSEEIYNRPGVVHEENWMLRVPEDRTPALDLVRVLEMALRARGSERGDLRP